MHTRMNTDIYQQKQMEEAVAEEAKRKKEEASKKEKEEREAKKKEDEEARKKQKEEEEAKKKVEREAKQKQKEEEEAKKKVEREAKQKQKEEEDMARKKQKEEEEAKKQVEKEAKQKQKEEEEAKKKVEREAKQKQKEEEEAKKKADQEAKRALDKELADLNRFNNRLQFQTGSWEINHPTNQEHNKAVLEKLASFFKNNQSVSFIIHGKQALVSPKPDQKDAVSKKTFKECFPQEPDPFQTAFGSGRLYALQNARATATKLELQKMGCTNAFTVTGGPLGKTDVQVPVLVFRIQS